MANILKNPQLQGHTLVKYFTDKSGNTGAIENPDNWEYVFTPMMPDDPNMIPQSLHRDQGYCIAAGYRSWEAGYVQRGVPLRQGQRYVCKAIFTPDVNFPPNTKVDLTAIQWRFWIEGGGQKVWQEWQSTGKGQWKQKEETLFVAEATSDITVDVYFKAKSYWAGNVCDFNLYSLTMDEVPSDYGGPNVARIGVGASAAAQPQTVAPSVAATTASTSAPAARSAGGKDLGDVITDDDIEVIAAGLRAINQVTPNASVIAAMNRLADVLERMKK